MDEIEKLNAEIRGLIAERVKEQKVYLKVFKIQDKQTGKSSVHNWIKKLKGKASFCAMDRKHKAGHFEWANISRLYFYRLSDWIPLCPECHRLFDKGVFTIAEFKRRFKQAEENTQRYKESL